jgi:integrase
MERAYLAACPPILRDVATLLIDSGLRVGEAINLRWPDVHLDPISNSRYGWIQVRDGKSKNAKRAVPLVPRSHKLLREKWDSIVEEQKKAREQSDPVPSISEWVFPGDSQERPILATSLAHMHTKVCRPIIDGKQVFSFPEKFVLHGLRHTFLTRLGESGADAFTIMKVAEHSSVTVSQRYVHPTSGTVELAFERMERLGQKALEAKNDAA